MPNIKSAIKRVKTTNQRNAQNAAQKSAMRTAVKKVEAAIANKDVEAAKASASNAAKQLDKAATKGLIHKNAAARKKSRLAKQIDTINA